MQNDCFFRNKKVSTVSVDSAISSCIDWSKLSEATRKPSTADKLYEYGPSSTYEKKQQKKQKKKDQKKYGSDITFDNQSVSGVKEMFLGNFEERRQFGVSDITNTLALTFNVRKLILAL